MLGRRIPIACLLVCNVACADAPRSDADSVGEESSGSEGTEPFSVVVVVGYDGADSYAYLGGSSTGKINPTPQG